MPKKDDTEATPLRRACGTMAAHMLLLQKYPAFRAHQFKLEQDTTRRRVQGLKPDPRIYELALQGLGVSSPQSVLVDDMPANVEAARVLGMHGIVFRDTKQAQSDLNQLLT